MAKKSNILPLVLVGGAAVAAFMYFKNKTAAAKEAAPDFEEATPEGETAAAEEAAGGASTSTSTPGSTPVTAASYVTSLIPGALAKLKAKHKARKKRKKPMVNLTPWSNVPLLAPVTVKAKRKKKKPVKRRPRTRTVKGFDDLSVLY
jgi:hypothetical protein